MIGGPQQLRANLVELPVTSLLRPLAPKHRPYVVKFSIAGPRMHPVLDIRAHH